MNTAADGYLAWAIRSTPTCWWHDSADPRELEAGLERGAVGVTTNPFLTHAALAANRHVWADEIARAIGCADGAEARAEALMRIVVSHAAGRLLACHQATGGRQGWVCGQVNPARAGDRAAMLAMARRYSTWAPNIAVKLPATAAGLDVLEECVAEGITCTATVSFTVAQVLAAAARHRRGCQRARAAGRQPGRCFAVLMVGRLDDYLRDVALDARAPVEASDINMAGIAVAKRAAALLRQGGYEAELIIAALRGTYHMTELAGGRLIMSIAPAYQGSLMSDSLPRVPRFEEPVPQGVIARLTSLEEFVKAWEPDGLGPEQFIAYALTQKTLAQFAEAGWRLLETFAPQDLSAARHRAG